MNAKSSIASIANELENLPDRVEDARKALDSWSGSAMKMVKKYPGRSILGAFAIGFVLAKIARHA